MTCGIYKITNTINGKMYIGQSIDIEARWKRHICDYKNDSKNNKFYNAIKKYGLDNFVFSIICEVPKSALDEYEISYINYYDTVKNGYNSREGGVKGSPSLESNIKNSLSNTGKKRSEKTKQNLSKAKKGKMCGKDNHFYGKTHTEETKKKMKLVGKSFEVDGEFFNTIIEYAEKLGIERHTAARRLKKRNIL